MTARYSCVGSDGPAQALGHKGLQHLPRAGSGKVLPPVRRVALHSLPQVVVAEGEGCLLENYGVQAVRVAVR